MVEGAGGMGEFMLCATRTFYPPPATLRSLQSV
jgi:hypothetical protein